MALTRGTNSNFPCPVCLIPNEKLHDGTVYDSRTSESMQDVYNLAEGMSTAEEREAHLKDYGLRYVKVRQMLLCWTVSSDTHFAQ
jgi:hypothetical protein